MPVSKARATLWWIRRDLRLDDNQALTAALMASDNVIPIYFLDDDQLSAPRSSPKGLAFLFSGLKKLDTELCKRGSRLIIRRGETIGELERLSNEIEIDAIFAEDDVSPSVRQQDEKIAKFLPLHLQGGITIRPAGSVLKSDHTPYTVFTPFSRKWQALPLSVNDAPSMAPPRLPAVPNLTSVPIPDQQFPTNSTMFPAGEAEALTRLENFIQSPTPPIAEYEANRDRLDLDGTSGLSPHFRFGMVSPGNALALAYRALENSKDPVTRRGIETWITELIWREFYIHILYHFPHVQHQSFRTNLQSIQWENNPRDIQAWKVGMTGYPVVDAGMRQLLHTGWMHNRARMIVASFLVKDLLVDWRIGELYFMQQLIDGDLAANNGGWQWTAGTGTDASPYFRIFNPTRQGKKFDPEGNYVRQWVPELVQISNRFIHEPWKMSLADQKASGCIIGKNYPAPIIDHKWARERVLRVFAQARTRA